MRSVITAHRVYAGRRPGRAGGSVFLDEIDSLPLPAQAKLLRFLQSKEVRPVGANQAQQVDVRVIAASNRNLSDLVARGLFRQDLYFRLNVVNIELPSLRERRSDIPMLALHFVKFFATRFGRRVDAQRQGPRGRRFRAKLYRAVACGERRKHHARSPRSEKEPASILCLDAGGGGLRARLLRPAG